MTAAATVQPDYKMTEVGVIPVAWEVRQMGDLFAFSGGVSASREQLSDAGHCYLHYGDIHTSNKIFVDTRSEFQDIPKLNISLSKVPAKALLADGDVVFVDASEDDEGVSKHVVVSNKAVIPFISGLHTIVSKAKTEELDKLFRRYCFQNRAVKRQFTFYAVGTKVSGISKSNIAKVFVPIPPLAEQQAIAGALGDMDALIGALDALLAKKRDLKQAALQQLLTGRTRLPGFSQAWEPKRIGEVAEIISGGTPRTNEPRYWNGGIKWCTPTDITRHAGKYLVETERTISRSGLDNSGSVLLPIGALLLCSRATIGELKIATGPVCTNQGFKSLICRSGTNNQFLYYKLLTMKRQMVERAFGSTFLEISTRNIAALELAMPPLAEQTAIAGVLADMDAEIDALESRLAKTRALKQGMMQELLTGKTRLV